MMEAVKEKVELRRYSEYKDSGIEWLGEVPEKWQVLPGFAFLRERSEKNTGMKESQVLSLSYGNVIVKPEEKLTGLVPESFETYQLVYPGDIIIRPTDLQNDKTSLRTGIAKDKGIITSAYLNLSVNGANSNKYYHYLLHAIDTNKVIYGLGSGLRQNLSYEDFKRFSFPVPTPQEQTAIAKFLDRKTEQIDQAIEIKQRQIELLKERRQILIHKAVTRGLNPDAPLKPSGVDWLGDIPEHWEVKRFRNVFHLDKGLTITKENLVDEGVYCVNYGEIHSKYGFEVNPEIHELKCVDNDYLNSSPKSLLKKGDFIFADTSEDLEGSGNFTYLNSSKKTFAGYHTIIAKPKISFVSRFLAYAIDSLAFRNQIRTRVKGVKVYSISQSLLKETSVWLPPENEQKVIVDNLDQRCEKIDASISLIQEQIKILRNYKTTLINSAVTGKIKVS